MLIWGIVTILGVTSTMTISHCRQSFVASICCALAILLSPGMASADVDWVISSNSTIAFSGGTWLGGAETPFLEVSSGSLTAPLAGAFATNNSFTSNVIFGGSKSVSFAPAPAAPAAADPNYAANYSQYMTNYGSYLNGLTAGGGVLPSNPSVPAPGTANYSANYNQYLSNYSSYLNTFSSTAIYSGGKPYYPGKPSAPNASDPNFNADQAAALLKYGEWADTGMVAASAAQNHVLGVYTGNYQPTFPTPSVPIPISPLPANAGAFTPGLFGGLMANDFTADPPQYTPFAFRNFGQTFFTNTSEVSTDPLFPELMPTGAAVDLSNTPSRGEFSQLAIGNALFTQWDAYAPDFLGGAITGRSPVTGIIKNTSESPGVISRNGADYVMTFTSVATKYLDGDDAPSAILDIGTKQSIFVQAVANLVHGDVNFDGVVNIVDLALVADRWLQSDALSLNPGLIPGDANGNGTVNIVDLTMIADNWQQTSPPLGGGGSITAVPEPSTIFLLAVASVGLIVVRRRRMA